MCGSVLASSLLSQLRSYYAQSPRCAERWPRQKYRSLTPGKLEDGENRQTRAVDAAVESNRSTDNTHATAETREIDKVPYADKL